MKEFNRDICYSETKKPLFETSNNGFLLIINQYLFIPKMDIYNL
jgi:hypothetical protein